MEVPCTLKAQLGVGGGCGRILWDRDEVPWLLLYSLRPCHISGWELGLLDTQGDNTRKVPE